MPPSISRRRASAISEGEDSDWLKDEIRAAFSRVRQPDRILHEYQKHQKLSSRDYDLLDAFGGIRWRQVSNESLDEYFDALDEFGPQAFHYYVPAFLLRSLDRWSPDVGVCRLTFFALAMDPSMQGSHLERLAYFSPRQMSVVVEFLQRVLRDAEFHDGCFARARMTLSTLWRDDMLREAKRKRQR